MWFGRFSIGWIDTWDPYRTAPIQPHNYENERRDAARTFRYYCFEERAQELLRLPAVGFGGFGPRTRTPESFKQFEGTEAEAS